MTDSLEKRVIVCGGGLAGLSAAVTALEDGACVTLIEKAPEVGGSSALSGGAIWTFADFEELRAAIPDGDTMLQWLVYDNIDAARDWLATQNVTLAAEELHAEQGRRARSINPPQAIAALAEKFLKLGGQLRLESALDALIVVDGIIKGVRIAHGSGTQDEAAGAVVLATGGFQGNPELLSRYVVRNPDNLYLRANAWSTGDGFLAATQAGAAASPGLDTYYGHALAAPPARFSKLELRDMSQYYGQQAIAVNLRGERFADESDGTAEQVLNQRLAQQPGGSGFYIIDQELMDSPVIKGRPLLTRVIVGRAQAAKAPVIVADTIAELCRKLSAMGVPESKLFREITEFNRALESQQADDLEPARRRNRKSLCKPPYYAIGVQASITFTMGGLQIDERARVLRRSGGSSPSSAMPPSRALTDADALSIGIGADYRQTAIAGLYAAGCDAGNMSHFDYMGGLAVALVTGRTAGNSAADYVRKIP